MAEGVETPTVRDRLAELGCELAQGFLFSRPVPAEDVEFGGLDPNVIRCGCDSDHKV